MPRGVSHPAEIRAQVVAAVVSGETMHSVANRFGLPYQTVQNWYSEDRPIEPSNARTREELGQLIYDAVAETLRSLTVRARVTGREDWITKQPAGELAALATADWDRVIRILAGFKPRDPELDSPPTSEAA